MGVFDVTGAAAIADYTGGHITLTLSGAGRDSVTVRMTPEVARQLIGEVMGEVVTAERIQAETPDDTVETAQGGAAAPESGSLPEHVRAELFKALADGTAELTDVSRADTGFRFAARVGDLVAYGALVRRTTLVIVDVYQEDRESGIAYQAFGNIAHAEATKAERTSFVAEHWGILCPRWAEFGTLGNKGRVHIREHGKSWTLCKRGVADGWVSKSDSSLGRCVNCNKELDKREGH